MISKDYFLTNHVRFRMKERDISEKEIAEVLKSPQVSYPGKKGEINVIKEIERGKRKEERGKRKEDKSNLYYRKKKKNNNNSHTSLIILETNSGLTGVKK